MYTPYVVGAYAAALLLLLVGLRVVGGSAPDLRGTRQVHRYLLCALASLFCFVLRIWIPALISIVSTNSLAFASALFLYLAAAEIQQAQPRLMPWLTALSAAGVAGVSWMPAVGDRLLLHCAIMAVIFAAAAAVLYRRDDETLARPRLAAAILMTLAAAHQAFWAVMSALYPPGPDYLLHLSALQTGLSYLTTIMACANVAALMWLSLSVHRLDLHRAAQTDALTGLLNRRAFEEILSRELPRCIRTGRNLGAMMIDIDHFKRINDTLGHRAGDDVLRYVAESLRTSTRISDVLARYGGEEFVVLLRDATPEESESVAERVRSGIATLSGLPGGVKLTVSIGVAMSRGTELPEEFLLRCDEATT